MIYHISTIYHVRPEKDSIVDIDLLTDLDSGVNIKDYFSDIDHKYICM